MRYRALAISIILVTILAIPMISELTLEEADALPLGYPIRLSGGYAVEQPNSTTYIDNLQPGDSENYLIHMYNTGEFQLTYRVKIVEEPEDWKVFLGNGADEQLVNLDPGDTRAVDLNMKVPKAGVHDIEILVRNEMSMEEWPITLTISCQTGPLLSRVPSLNYILGMNTPAVFEIELENIGNTVLNTTLSMEGILPSNSRIRESWTVIFSRRNLQVSPGTVETVQLSVWPPELEPVGSQKVTRLVAEVEGISRPFESGSLSFKVQTIFDLRASVFPIGYYPASPGDTIEFTATIENWAIDYDTVSVSVWERPAGWDIQFNDTIDPSEVPITINPEGEREIHPVVYIPRNAVAGQHKVILRAQGTTNITFFDLKLQIARQDEFQLTPLTPSGSDNTFKLTLGENMMGIKVVNAGNFYDTVTLTIENRPDFAPMTFHSIKVGKGTNVTNVNAVEGINISGQLDRTYLVQEDPMTTLKISFDPSQTATVFLKASIPLGSPARSGVVGIKYSYGIFQEQRFIQSSVKLILADIEIMDSDGDGSPDLMIQPLGDYEVGDKIGFSWVLKNNYPYPVSGLKWQVILSGKVLIEGDVPAIPTGETMTFNETWKADKKTNNRNVATLKIIGDAYTSEDKAPSTTSRTDVYIKEGKPGAPVALMAIFGTLMILIIAGFIGFFIWVRKDLENKEAVERGRYEEIYGMKERPALDGKVEGSRRPGKASSLRSSERPELPGKKPSEPFEPRKKSRKRPSSPTEERERTEDRPRKRSGPGKKASSFEPDSQRNSKRKARKLEQLEEIEELEELEEMEEL